MNEPGRVGLLSREPETAGLVAGWMKRIPTLLEFDAKSLAEGARQERTLKLNGGQALRAWTAPESESRRWDQPGSSSSAWPDSTEHLIYPVVSIVAR